MHFSDVRMIGCCPQGLKWPPALVTNSWMFWAALGSLRGPWLTFFILAAKGAQWTFFILAVKGAQWGRAGCIGLLVSVYAPVPGQAVQRPLPGPPAVASPSLSSCIASDSMAVVTAHRVTGESWRLRRWVQGVPGRAAKTPYLSCHAGAGSSWSGCESCVTPRARCWCSTRCSAAWAAPASCGRTSTTA
jgi:hypothetical protein